MTNGNAFVRLNELESRYLDFFRDEGKELIQYLIGKDIMSPNQVREIVTPVGDFFEWLGKRIKELQQLLEGVRSLTALTEVMGGIVIGIADFAEKARHSNRENGFLPLAVLLEGLGGLSGLGGQAELGYLNKVLPNPVLLGALESNALAIHEEVSTLITEQLKLNI